MNHLTTNHVEKLSGRRWGQGSDDDQPDVDAFVLDSHTVTCILELGWQGAALSLPRDGYVRHSHLVLHPPRNLVLQAHLAKLLDHYGDGVLVSGQSLQPAHKEVGKSS